MWTLLGVLVGGLYVGGPILVYFTYRLPKPDGAKRSLTRSDDASMSDEARGQLDLAEAALRREGFGQPTRLVMNGGSNTTRYLSVLEHDDRSAVAAVQALQVRGSGRTVVRGSFHLRSDFQDGPTMFTNHQTIARAVPRIPHHDAAWFRSVTDVASLWRIHRRRVERRTRSTPTVRPTRDGDLLDYVNRETAEIYEHWIAIGYLRRLPDGRLGPTMRGAVLMFWRSLFPWRQITDWRDARVARSHMALD